MSVTKLLMAPNLTTGRQKDGTFWAAGYIDSGLLQRDIHPAVHAWTSSAEWKKISARGRLRVSATRKPMPSASEISDEPP